MESVSDMNVSRVSKRVSISNDTSIEMPSIRAFQEDKLIIFSPSVEILKNGPTLRKATEILINNGHKLKYQDLIAAVDGLDLTVARIESEGKKLNCRPSFFSTKTFSFGTKQVSTCHIGHHNAIRNQKIKNSSHVYCWGRYRNYSYEMVDRLMAEQLWPGNGAPSLFADIEFLVSGVVFKAHRAIVSARSAVFAAMFASGMRESETGRVEITDASPETFADFLKFVYTGQLDTPCFANSQLGYCADKYEVKTLSDLCSGSKARKDSAAFKAAFTNFEHRLTKYENDASLLSTFINIYAIISF